MPSYQKQPTHQPLTIGDTGSTFPACTWKVFVSGWPCVFRAQAGHVGDAKSPKRFQVPNTEGFLILMWVAIWGMGRLPYIRLTYSLYRWGFLHFRNVWWPSIQVDRGGLRRVPTFFARSGGLKLCLHVPWWMNPRGKSIKMSPQLGR